MVTGVKGRDALRGPAGWRLVALAVALAAVLPAGASAATATFTARGSVEQVQLTGAEPGAKLTLVDKRGKKVERKTAGSLGGIVFRHIEPGGGYLVKQGSAKTDRFRVLSDKSAPPDPSIYDQSMPGSGYGYLTTRDGTKLAVNTYLPGPVEAGPYPTLIEYSGYGYANPNGGESSIQPIAALLGYAVVDVNMRGTGCSGGAFDFFETLQGLDGYDVIETVARQPWVLNNKVGMLGVSYGGISQLFVAKTRPPSLSAITPLSVIDSTQTTLYPGGVLNTGFALEWAMDRVDDSQPASPTTGQSWAWERIENGDEICKENQQLHPEAVNLLGKIERNQYYKPKVADPLAPVTFVKKIDVPVFMACQWTDEQTGGHCPTLAAQFTGTDRKWFTFTNGVHTDSLDPATFNRWYDFIELYVAGRKPRENPAMAAAPVLYEAVLGVHGVTLPHDPIQDEPDYASALAAFEALPQVRILFDNGAGSNVPGNPVPGFEQSFAKWPVPGTKARSLFLDARRQARLQAPVERRQGQVQRQPDGAAADRLHRRHGRRPERPLDRDPAVRLDPEPGRDGRELRDLAAVREHDRARRRRTAPLGAIGGQAGRPAGDRLRGPARRQGDLRPERLAARRPEQARPGEEHQARAGAGPAKARQAGPVGDQVDQGDGPALLPGPRLPRRVGDPGDRERRRRRPAGLGLRRGEAVRKREGDDRALAGDAVEAAAAGRRRRCPDRPAALPGPARRALPRLRAVREPQLAAALVAPGYSDAGHSNSLRGGGPGRSFVAPSGRRPSKMICR